MAEPICTLDSWTLDIGGITDTFDKSLAKYEFPYRDGVLIEDMGAGARTIKIKSWWADDRFNDHVGFLEHISETKKALFELRHPTYGMAIGKIENIVVDRSEEYDQCVTIEFDFIEQDEPSLSIVLSSPYNSVRDSWESGQQEQMDVVAADTNVAFGPSAGDILSVALTQGQEFASRIINTTLDIRRKLLAVDRAIFMAESLLSSITVAADEAAEIFDYPSTLPGKITGAFARVCARYASSIEAIASVPDQYISSVCADLTGLVYASNFWRLDDGTLVNDLFPCTKHLAIAASQYACLASSQRLQEDIDAFGELQAIEGSQAFDVAGNYLNPPDTPQIMSIDQIERSLEAVRTIIQNGIDAAREMQTLKKMALTLLVNVDQIRIDRPSIYEITIDNEKPLHAILLAEGIDYRMAERIMTINPQISNPFAVRGSVRLLK